MQFVFLFLAALAWGESPPWILLGKEKYLTLKDWQTYTGYQPFYDSKSGKIVLERKGKAPILLLLNSPYALQGELFLSIPQPPKLEVSHVILSEDTGKRLFLNSLSGEEKKKFEQKFIQTEVAPTCIREKNVQRIFLDPGHGGEDAGTTHGKATEKEIVLRFSRMAADELRKHGFQVSFSRTKDVFLPLDIRTKIAEEWKADVFISLHVNSSSHAGAHGTETYILNQEATDAEARKLALLENSIVEKAKEKSSAIQDILWDMEQTSYLQESAYLASHLQGAIVSHALFLLAEKKLPVNWKNRGVRQAPFYVLNRAAMPAVLVELGYLSNPRDRKLLGEKYFLESLAKALAEGVKKYKESCRSEN
jgi:N-acetylmuramoyl-L-alanine amidase